MNKYSKMVSAKIKDKRAEMGLSLNAFVALYNATAPVDIRLSVTGLSRIENGKRSIDADKYEKAMAL